MTMKHGKNTKVLLGAVDMSPYLDSMDLASDLDVSDTTMFGATWKSALPGVMAGKVDFSGLYDPTQASLPTLFLSLVPGVLTYCPGGGAAIGDGARLVSAIDTSYALSSPVGGMVAVKGSFQADSTVGFGWVLHPLGADVDSTAGATRDDAAATSTGWTAHLHVISRTAGSWNIYVEDSANGTDWTALANFGDWTGAGSMRMVGATAAATLRRYLRYVAVRTGGSASDSVTFAIAYARN
jgi:hypothetical protein